LFHFKNATKPLEYFIAMEPDSVIWYFDRRHSLAQF
jgi:hypothetical protein